MQATTKALDDLHQTNPRVEACIEKIAVTRRLREGLIRISAGLEELEDLKPDIVQALQGIGPVTNLSIRG